MKKFIPEIIALFLLLLLSAGVLYRTDKPYQLKQLDSIERELEIINLGTSHGWDFIYSDCPLYGMNFNVSANTLYYDLQLYRLLRNKNYLADSAVIILPVSYFVFGLDENRTDRLPDDSFVDQFYHYLPPRSIYNYSLKKEIEIYTHIVQKNFTALITDEEKDRCRTRKETDEVKTEKKVAKEKTPAEWAEELEKIAVTRVKGHRNLSRFSAESKNIEYIETLLREIQDAGHRPVLVTTPYHTSYNRNFGYEWLQENYFPKMYALSAKYNVPYLDYSHDEQFTCNPELFMDTDHLNDRGRPIFSAIIFEDIDKAFRNRKADP